MFSQLYLVIKNQHSKFETSSLILVENLPKSVFPVITVFPVISNISLLSMGRAGGTGWPRWRVQGTPSTTPLSPSPRHLQMPTAPWTRPGCWSSRTPPSMRRGMRGRTTLWRPDRCSTSHSCWSYCLTHYWNTPIDWKLDWLHPNWLKPIEAYLKWGFIFFKESQLSFLFLSLPLFFL